MLQTVRVRLRKSTRIQLFLARDISLSAGDACVVRTDRGLEYGICVTAPEDCPEDKVAQYPMSVVRKATYSDENTYRQILLDEEKAKALCMGKIIQRDLPMRLVNVEYTLDRHKVVFYFTADDRVDFRELVRDLAHELKTRIELRHIQVRDKSKLVGGLAACGRELCCATWLGDFMPISMKMAKRQNLSLNPSKISGQCGRLMCCLGYENHCYSDRKKKPAQETPADESAAARNGAGDDAQDWDDVEEDAALAAADELDDAADAGETVYEAGPAGASDSAEPAEGEQPKRRSRRRPRRRRKRSRAGEAESS